VALIRVATAHDVGGLTTAIDMAHLRPTPMHTGTRASDQHLSPFVAEPGRARESAVPASGDGTP